MISDDPRAMELADRSVEVARPLANEYLLALTLEAAGLARYRTDPTVAIALLDESMAVAGDSYASVTDMSLFFKGIAHVSLRNYALAAESLSASLARHHTTGASYYQSMVLAAIAGLLIRTGSVPAATRLLGALEHLRDDARMMGAPRDLGEQEKLRNRLQQITGPEEFAALWAAGRTLNLDEAVSLARSELTKVSE